MSVGPAVVAAVDGRERGLVSRIKLALKQNDAGSADERLTLEEAGIDTKRLARAFDIKRHYTERRASKCFAKATKIF